MYFISPLTLTHSTLILGFSVNAAHHISCIRFEIFMFSALRICKVSVSLHQIDFYQDHLDLPFKMLSCSHVFIYFYTCLFRVALLSL